VELVGLYRQTAKSSLRSFEERRNIAQSRVIGMVSKKIALSQATIMFFMTGGKFHF
jgi:hypothetical protein